MKKKYNSRDSKRHSDVVSFGDSLREYLKTFKIKDKYQSTFIVASWEKVMGHPIAKKTEKVFIKERTLYVKLSSAPLKKELAMSKSKICRLLNEHAGEEFLENVVFL